MARRATTERKAANIRAQRKYEQTEKGRAALHRYRQTAKGKAALKRSNEKRIQVAHRTIYAESKEQRDQLAAHVQRRRRELVERQQARAEAEGYSVRAVSTKAAP